MKTFYKLLGVALIVSTTNTFVWFALTFWAYLTTNSVISTSIVGGVFIGAAALSGIWFGSIVDHNRKKTVSAVCIFRKKASAKTRLEGCFASTS